MKSDTWTIEIKGPNGVRIVELTDEAVKGYDSIEGDAYVSAAWLAGWSIRRAIIKAASDDS